MFSTNLEKTLHHATELASERRHKSSTLEHLLTALTKDQDVLPILRACNVDVEQLRTELNEFLSKERGDLVLENGKIVDAKPTDGFLRVVQRAAIQSTGRDEITAANVLVALFSERESHAVNFLAMQEMTRLDAVNYILHGTKKSGPKREMDTRVEPSSSLRLEAASEVHTRHTSASKAHVPKSNEKAKQGPVSRPQAEKLLKIIAERTKARYLRGISDPR